MAAVLCLLDEIRAAAQLWALPWTVARDHPVYSTARDCEYRDRFISLFPINKNSAQPAPAHKIIMDVARLPLCKKMCLP